MSDVVLIAIIAAVPPTILAAATLLVGLRTKQTVASHEHKVNSRLDELMRVSQSLAHAEGRAEGVEHERIRQKES